MLKVNAAYLADMQGFAMRSLMVPAVALCTVVGTERT